MIKNQKQTNIVVFIKLIILSFMFCLPRAPEAFAENNFITATSQSKINPFILPSNAHFEHKVLKKIVLLESILPENLTYLGFKQNTWPNLTPAYTFSRICHFINSSYARGPPLFS